ncbi:hypothetical protein DBB29_19525 [Pandoraea cepalis]|uniref:Lipoprotein n=1 Tax=Pandoraea cepalis TaxID=2508294 RepID=A0AAW7MQL2_9BURK|nr:hypothetical protein [Pandoraea cepalis]MDN4574796.1 hypothetical protein [Pandoraea cepalis]MDN4580299.1 hypothetical protein [Pandoraea cepalis]
MNQKQTPKHQTFVRPRHLAVTLPLILALAACTKPTETSNITTPTTLASAASSSNEAQTDSSASAPVVSVAGANLQSDAEDADAQEADETGTAIGTVMKADVSSGGRLVTPFGALSVNDNNLLMLNGKVLSPRVEGNNSLSFVAQAALRNRRAVLVQDNGGTACPAIYRWVIVSDGAYVLSPPFGSCSDLVSVAVDSDVLVVTMPGFVGPFEPAAAQKSAARKRMTYRYNGQTLTENGKVVRGQ